MRVKSAQGKSNWRAIQARSKIRGKIQLALFILGFIALIYFISWGAEFIHNITQPLGLQSFKKTYFWDGSSSLNMVFKGSEIYFLSLDPNEKKLSIVKLPQQVYVEVPGDYGRWQLRSVYRLGDSEKSPAGPQLLKATLANLFKLPVDGILIFDDSRSFNPQKFVETLKQNPLEIFRLLPSIKTDLTPSELIRFSLGLRSVRFDKISEFDLLSLGLLDVEQNQEGDVKLLADPEKLDGFVFNNLSDSRIQQEGLEVAIFNTTMTSGLGQKAAQIISHLGANVIQVGSIPDQNLEKNLITVKNEKEADMTLKRLKQIFGKECFDPKICAIISHPTILSSRGQVIVILGKDF